jgi:carboxyl-terminal processing protease
MAKAVRERWHRPVEADFRIAQTVGMWLTCPTGGKKTIRYLSHGAKAEKTKTAKCTMLERERVSLGNLENVPVEVEHHMLAGGKVGYLRFNIWMLPLVPKIDAGLADLRKRGMQALVLDLRGNPGGVGAMVVPLGRQLLSEDADLGVMHMRDAEQKFAVTAGEDPFTGPVAILVDEGTGSTSEIFAQAMQDLGRVQVYGASASQGAALPSLIEQLEGGGLLQYVVADYRSPKDIAVEGRGVQPDHVVEETRTAFAQGADPVLDAAVAALKHNPKSS